MNLSIFLGVFGPWELRAGILFLGIIVGIVVLIVILATKNSTTRTQQLDNTALDQLTRVNKLKQEGALTEVAYEIEKRKILNQCVASDLLFTYTDINE